MSSPRAHILFVDDEPALRELTAERLAELEFDVVQASNGEEAISLLDEFAFDVVITDLRMPGTDGLGVLDRLARPDVVLASNTSSISLTWIASATTRPTTRAPRPPRARARAGAPPRRPPSRPR